MKKTNGNCDLGDAIDELAIGWGVLIRLLHVIEPELDPKQRMVSEYACGRRGWIMQAAFFCMTGSCWSLALALSPYRAVPGQVLLVLCGIGFAGAGVFVTDPILPNEALKSRSGGLHVLFAFVVMLLFPIMASTVTVAVLPGLLFPRPAKDALVGQRRARHVVVPKSSGGRLFAQNDIFTTAI